MDSQVLYRICRKIHMWAIQDIATYDGTTSGCAVHHTALCRLCAVPARTDPWSIEPSATPVLEGTIDLGSADLLNLSGQYTFGETNRISRLKISGCVLLVRVSSEFKPLTMNSRFLCISPHLKYTFVLCC